MKNPNKVIILPIEVRKGILGSARKELRLLGVDNVKACVHLDKIYLRFHKEIDTTAFSLSQDVSALCAAIEKRQKEEHWGEWSNWSAGFQQGTLNNIIMGGRSVGKSMLTQQYMHVLKNRATKKVGFISLEEKYAKCK